MCDKAVDDFLPALKLVPVWFVTSKMKCFNFLMIQSALFKDDILFLRKILVMSHFLVMKWVFLV